MIAIFVFTPKEEIMNPFVRFALTVFVLLNASLWSVEYGGEKSDLLETRYQVCVVPPQVDEAAAKGITVVSVEEAKALYDDNARFFDARSPRHYSQARIKGAYPVVFDQSKADYIAVQLPRDKDAPVVFYCYGESCAASYEAALAVRGQGYTRVYWLLNGFGGWEARRYPVEP